MAHSKNRAGHSVMFFLNQAGIEIDTSEKERLTADNVVHLFGQTCKVANVRTPKSFGVIVNQSWFQDPTNFDKPFFTSRDTRKHYDIDYILFPTKKKLLGIHYLKLRQNCLELEQERNKWFSLKTWGLEVDENEEVFNWTGGNQKKFKLDYIFSKEFEIQTLIETPHPFDFEDPVLPNRSQLLTYRILRDTKISRGIKALYDHKCQLCGARIQIGINQYYAEAHHLKPLGAPHNGPDATQNVLCVCPNHHVELDYGAIPLDKNKLLKNSKHEISNEYIFYHNNLIFKP